MKRKLGRSQIQISAMGLGCWAIGGPFWSGKTPHGWGEVDDGESLRAIQVGIEGGITFFDTADVYGTGHSELVLGKAIEGKRDKVVIATKFGNKFDMQTKQVIGSGAEPDYIRRACDQSLRRLKTDYIDLYQFHINNYDPALAEPVRDTLEKLVKDGKIKFYAWSTDFVDRASIFEKGKYCTAIQHQINVINDNAEMIKFVEKYNLASINRGPLAMGLLTGKYNANTTLSELDVRGKNAPEWMKYFKDGKPAAEWLKKIELIKDILTTKDRTVAQGAIAWLWARSPQTIPIPGFRTVAQVKDLVGAMDKGPLTKAQMTEIKKILGE